MMKQRTREIIAEGQKLSSYYFNNRNERGDKFSLSRGAIATFLLIALGISFSSCDSSYNECVDQPDIDGTEVNIEIEQLQDKLANVQSREELAKLLEENVIIREYFMKRSTYPNDSVMLDVLMKKFQNPHIDTLSMEVQRIFGDLSGLKEDLSRAFSHLKYYYPDAKIPKIKTVISGLAHDMYFSDSLIVIGLDYYLGEGAKFRPLSLYQYMLQRYSPEYIAPSIMLLKGISDEYNTTKLSDKTALADMVAYGKSFYFAKRMMPCVPDSVLIWYTQEEIEGVRENKKVVWAHMLENEILFETNHMIKKKYLDERPKTYEIGEKAPGRIATWVGWDIVKEYMERNPDVTLNELMQTADAQEIFRASKYKP